MRKDAYNRKDIKKLGNNLELKFLVIIPKSESGKGKGEEKEKCAKGFILHGRRVGFLLLRLIERCGF